MFIIFLITILLLVYWQLATKGPKRYPPGPKWLLIVGNTSMLRKATRKYGSQIAVLRAWQEQYKSNVIGLKLGNELVLVALTYAVIHEVHINDAFDGRPDNLFLRLRTMGSRLGVTCADGALWSEQRNFVSRHLRRSGYGRVAMEEQIQFELNELLDIISQYDEKPVWPGSFLSLSVLNVLWTFTAGKKMSRCDTRLVRLLELMKERSRAFDMSGGWLNTMPFVRFIAPEKTSYNLIKRFNSELYSFFMPIIAEHKKKLDLIYAFINEMEQQDSKKTNFTDTQLVMVILDLFIAGAQSASNTLDFILMTLALNPDIQQKCHNVIDSDLGSAELPSLSDKTKLTYIEAVIFETQRNYNIVPVSGPRRVLRETMLDGDLGDANSKIVNTERLVAFGQGRRRCLREALARACLFTYTVGILQKFRLEIPPNSTLAEKTTQPGLLTSPTPYKIVLKHRTEKLNQSWGKNHTDNIPTR